MKTLNMNFRALAAVLLFSMLAFSCEKEKDNATQARFESFFATTESADETKVYADDQLRVLWNADDRISVFNKNTCNQEYRFDGNDGDDSGTFSLIDTSVPSSDDDLPLVYAVYPYNRENKVDDDEVLTVEIPHKQQYREGTFAPESMVMVSATADQYLRFRNVCGILSLKLYGQGSVTSITLRGNNGEHLSGEAAITIAPEELPETQLAGNVYDTIELQCEGVSLSNAPDQYKEFWFIVPPMTFTKGFTATVTLEDGVLVKSTEKAVTISRSTISRMAAFDATFIDDGHVVFDDPVFKAYCVGNFDTDGDGEISYLEDEKVISIDVNSKDIKSLTGVEHFKNLDKLYCSNNQLTSLDVSKNTALSDLNCRGNRLSSLDVSKNTALVYLICDQNELSSLVLGRNTLLKKLTCSANQIPSMSLDGFTELWLLDCSFNCLTSLDVSSCVAMKHLIINDNTISELYLGDHSALYELHCHNNEISSLDVSGYKDLAILTCFTNQLASLDVSGLEKLDYLQCWENGMTSLNVDGCVGLRDLQCSQNLLSELDISSNVKLRELNCSYNRLISIDFSNNPELTFVNLDSNCLSSLNVGCRTNLDYLDCSGNFLTSLDVTENAALRILYCMGNQLTSLDVSKNPILEALGITSNRISSIDTSNNPALVLFYCEDNLLTSLDVSCNPALTELWCYFNPYLTEIWLKTGQTIQKFLYDTAIATVYYK